MKNLKLILIAFLFLTTIFIPFYSQKVDAISVADMKGFFFSNGFEVYKSVSQNETKDILTT